MFHYWGNKVPGNPQVLAADAIAIHTGGWRLEMSINNYKTLSGDPRYANTCIYCIFTRQFPTQSLSGHGLSIGLKIPELLLNPVWLPTNNKATG